MENEKKGIDKLSESSFSCLIRASADSSLFRRAERELEAALSFRSSSDKLKSVSFSCKEASLAPILGSFSFDLIVPSELLESAISCSFSFSSRNSSRESDNEMINLELQKRRDQRSIRTSKEEEKSTGSLELQRSHRKVVVGSGQIIEYNSFVHAIAISITKYLLNNGHLRTL